MGEQTQLEAARFIGISKSNITRWKDGGRAAPDFVVKVARAYGANVIEALVEAEFITEEEAALREVNTGGLLLEQANSDQLTREVEKRLKASEEYEAAFQAGIEAANRAPLELFYSKALSDHDDLIARINSGEEQVAAQEATDPLDENQP
ncbi:helix-turn-helix transcriptional regulator [Corynebacterium sp.]|uniref:helix-turn-helix domain-containing protein n=1 Tax=Corynebacterium sp. TaxID=1720 RepID=UPI0028B05519|nr:helix-turn-helix transcriptional regulator [Corynebacterium sp.]